MSKNSKEKGPSKKAIRRQQARMLFSITSVLIIFAGAWIWFNGSQENTDLSLIGQGKNVVVQVHDPG